MENYLGWNEKNKNTYYMIPLMKTLKKLQIQSNRGRTELFGNSKEVNRNSRNRNYKGT